MLPVSAIKMTLIIKKMITKKNFAFAILFCLVAVSMYLFYGNSRTTTTTPPVKNLEKVKVQAGWIINGEFANICSAIVNGYYAKEGLDVELIPGGPSGASFIVSTNTVAQDESVDIAIDNDLVPLLLGRGKENQEVLRAKAFGSFWNDNPLGFIVNENSGLDSINDFAKTKPNGEKYKIGITAGDVIQNAIAENIGVPVSELNLVTIGCDATPFLSKQVDASIAYWTTQAYQVEKAGIPYKFLSASEIPGFSQPSMIAIARETTIKNKPEMLEKWLKATVKGNQFVAANPETAAKQMRDPRCGGPSLDEEQELWLIKKSIALFDKEKIGWIYEPQVSTFAQKYYHLGQISHLPETSELVDYSILEKIYQ